MNSKNFFALSFIWIFLLAGCATVLQDMEGGVSGRHYTTKSFSIPAGSSDSISFNVNTQGSISATLSTRGLASSETGTADSMAMALQNPTQAEMVRNEGNPHEKLKIRYRVPRSAQEGTWTVVLTNTSQRTISGTLKVYYPYEDTGATTASSGGGAQYPDREPTSQNEPAPQQDTWGSQDGGYSGGGGSSGGYEESPPPPAENYPPPQQTSQAPSQSPSQTTQQAPQPSEQPQQAPQTTGSRKILVVNPKVLRTATATRPVQYGVKLDTFDLTLGRDMRDKFYFNVKREGTIDVYVRWQKRAQARGGTVKLAVILNGPSQEGYLARKDGFESVHLRYQVKQSDIVAGRQWKVTIARFDEAQASGDIGRDIAQLAPIKGNLQIRYPKE